MEMAKAKPHLPGYILRSLCLFFCILTITTGISVKCKYGQSSSVIIEPIQVIFEVDPRFYSFGLGCNLDWSKKISLSHPVLRSLVRELSPSYLRLGGTLCQTMTFCEEEDVCGVDIRNITLTSDLWDDLNAFVKDVRLDLIYDANILRRTPDGAWDPTNFKEILEYSSSRGFPLSFELGNEPNSYKHKFNRTLSPEKTAAGFTMLKRILREEQLYRDSLIIGPDTTRVIGNPVNADAKEYLRSFLDSIGNMTDVTSSHFYYKGRPDTETGLEFFTDPATLDQFAEDATEFRNLVRDHRPPDRQQMWIGESGLFPAAKSVSGISDRFISGMVWLDKLGVAAVSSMEVVVRNTLAACGPRSLISPEYVPRPDYWSAVLFKRLVGTKVLDINTTSLLEKNVPATLRVYAHCTQTNKSKYGYKPGAITVFAVNFDPDEEVELVFSATSVDLFLLTPSRTKNITSAYIALNGRELSAEGGVLPPMPPRPVSSSPVLPPWSMAFFILRDADFRDCTKN